MKLLHPISTLLFIFLVSTLTAHAQIGIGTTTPDPSAALDIESTTQGVLIPRMLKAQRELIGGGSPAAGMLVYQTDDAAGFYFYDGTAWVSLSTKTPSGLESIDEGNGNGLVKVGRNQTNYGNVGQNAVDLSYSNNASTTNGATGFRSTAIGYNTEASGEYATAMGRFTEATGDFSTAMGGSTTASGDYATAIGTNTTASGFRSTAMGTTTTASGDYTMAMGTLTTASVAYATAMGFSTTASRSHATAMGYNTTASGAYATALGFFTQAESYQSTAIGLYNVGGGSPTSNIATDPLFEIGNGSLLNRSNALTVLKNGNVGIGITTPSQALDVVGNAEINGTAIVSNGLQVDNTTLFVNANTNRVGIGTTSPSQVLDLVGNAEINGNLQVDNTSLFVNASSNRVGIGTTSPSQALDVIGNAEINGTAIVNGNANISGAVNADGHLYGQRTAFSAYEDTTISLTPASATVNLDFSDITDPFNRFNGTIFTAPRSGLYFFSTSVSFDNGDGQDDTMWMGFSVNNASPSSQIVINPRAFTSSGREQTYSHTMVLNLISGDNVRVQLLSVSSATDVRVLERTFTGFYLGDL